MPKDRLTKERNLHELEGCYEACIRSLRFRTSKDDLLSVQNGKNRVFHLILAIAG